MAELLAITTLKNRLARIIARASEGDIKSDDVLASENDLRALGMSSLMQLRVVDAIESDLGVSLDLERENLSYLDSLNGIIGFLRDRGLEAE